MISNEDQVRATVEKLKQIADVLKSDIGPVQLTLELHERFENFRHELEIFESQLTSSHLLDLMGRANYVASRGEHLVSVTRAAKLNVRQELLDELLKQAARLSAMISVPNENGMISLRDLEEAEKDLRKQINIEQGRLTEIEIKINTLHDTASNEIQKISLAYEETRAVLDEKKAQIDELVGHASAQVVAGDYAKSSEVEKRMADMLRWGSIACMAFVVAILGVTAFKSLDAEIHWENFVIRITLALLLSVPAAYLARESAKHREQQYQHLQTSLDLKAITPFLASLPPEEQHKIKIDIASKIFAGRDFSRVGADPFPINAHELVMEIIKKLELPKGASRGPGQ
ncbi:MULTISPECIES: hypothetical protein [Pseudomonas]|uniref:Uncharacterized protein n=1 Tax=Pseudomonas putida NBRC 14164 TaxID=1211579 RepID=A0ABN5UKS4_PSEPU|nr:MULTISPECIES: hypothetical protein [Pseudomonas]MCX9135599.1 hypothetical protein [Pseudomonas sp. DCB_PUT]MDD1969592.1 hypothetical protein [Pseudomonas putida]MDO1464822.1 hypothetical protein [Pseudomonas putida]MDO1470192.1 hypothetical protein [Pseudomonas putida]MDZ7325898.1 hypothetical protein [Pseudomonas sp. SDS3-8]